MNIALALLLGLAVGFILGAAIIVIGIRSKAARGSTIELDGKLYRFTRVPP